MTAGETTVTPVARAWSATARRRDGAVFAVWSRPYELVVTTPAGEDRRVRVRDLELRVVVGTLLVVTLAAACRVRRGRTA